MLLLLQGLFHVSEARQLFPYLQAPSQSGMVITWKTDPQGTTQSIIRFGTSATSLSQTKVGTTAIYTDAGYSNNYYYHSVRLNNLQPNTLYYYRAVSGSDSSEVCTFKTLPLPGQAATTDGHIRFLVMGDNQIKNQPRFDSLVVAAKRKIMESYGWPAANHFALNVMVGDQVDVGTLDHYENVHFNKNKYLSPYLPITTIVGNHETYGTLGIGAYRNHFFYDSLSYRGISSGTEDYYALQAGNVLFINTNTENTGGNQFSWVQQVVTAANADPTVEWIVSLGHRPYQAEQYIGDISTWIRNTVVPYLQTSPKFVLHIGAHHHLYARGQMKNTPNYNIISGGTAWDQYWGMSTQQDYDDVQKTISNWGYQIIDVDVLNRKFSVECYSIGSIYNRHNNRLIDSFHRQLGRPAPARPSILARRSDTLNLPDTIKASAFVTTTAERLNTSEFEISRDAAGRVVEKTVLRDFENFFGDAGAPDTTRDINRNTDIKKLLITANMLPNGRHYVRVRYRDSNLEWSPWSVRDSFLITNGGAGLPAVRATRRSYLPSDTIRVNYSNGPGGNRDWVGLYRLGDRPGSGGGAVASRQWFYTNSSGNGQLVFTPKPANIYFLAYFINDGYTEIAVRDTIYIGPTPTLTVNQSNFRVTDTVRIRWRNAPNFALDWIGIYKIGMTPGPEASLRWRYTADTAGTFVAPNLGKGYYFAKYFLRDGFYSPSEPVYFSIGDTITRLTIDRSNYMPGEYISSFWTDGPGNPKDWLGVYDSLANPNIVPLIKYNYIAGRPVGNQRDTLVPNRAGSYFIVMFTNDSYTEVSNRCYFRVTGPTEVSSPSKKPSISIYPNPTAHKAVLESDYPIDRIEVLNSKGATVFHSDNIESKQYNFLCHELPAGTYFIKIILDNRQQYTYQLVVEKK